MLLHRQPERKDYEKRYEESGSNVYKLFVKAESILSCNMPAMMLTVYACILGLSWFGANMIVGGELTTGQLVSLFSYIMNIMMSLMMLSMVFVMVTMAKASAERIAEVIEEKSEKMIPVMECSALYADFLKGMNEKYISSIIENANIYGEYGAGIWFSPHSFFERNRV